MINIYNIDNKEFEIEKKADIVFADYIYENFDFPRWINKYWDMLGDNGIFIAMTDWHTQHRFRVFMEDTIGAYFVNHLVNKCEWGKPPSKNFHQCYDDILIYSKSKTWDFDGSKIQVPKATAKSKGLNPSGRDTKTATAWIDDCVLTTVSNERVKNDEGHLVRWQKPLKLYDRILNPFIKDGMVLIDPFAGTMSLGLWCSNNNIEYYGIEIDKEIFRYGCNNLKDNNIEFRKIEYA